LSNLTRTVDGYQITTDGSLVCPSPDRCDVQMNERFEAYVERHCADHKIDITYSLNAERNLGLNCGYFDHKYIWGNPTLTPQPFWELHAFVTQWDWNVADLETDKPVSQRTFRVPPADKRAPAEYRRMKQVEVPRQSQKTSTGARWYSVFRSKREYFINDKANYRIIIRSATGKNTRDTLSVIRRMASGSQKIKELYGVWMAHCEACSRTTQSAEKFTFCGYEDCRKKLRKPVRRVGLVNERKGAGAYGADMVSFRWLTNAETPMQSPRIRSGSRDSEAKRPVSVQTSTSGTTRRPTRTPTHGKSAQTSTRSSMSRCVSWRSQVKRSCSTRGSISTTSPATSRNRR
jgi:hypothetical protein